MNNIFKTIVVASLVVSFSIANAEDDGVSLERIDSFCEDTRSTSETIMDARQGGVSKIKIYQAINDNPQIKVVVDMAYEVRVYSSDHLKDSISKEFGIKVRDKCVELMLEAYDEYKSESDTGEDQ